MHGNSVFFLVLVPYFFLEVTLFVVPTSSPACSPHREAIGRNLAEDQATHPSQRELPTQETLNMAVRGPTSTTMKQYFLDWRVLSIFELLI